MAAAGPTSDPEASAPEASVSSRDRVRRGLVRAVLDVVVDPIRTGRLRDVGWGSGLRAAVALSLVLYAVLVAVVLGAGWLRTHTDLVSVAALSLPRIVVPLFFVLVVWSLSLLQAASLHLHPVLRIGVLLFTVVVLFSFSADLGHALSRDRVVTYAVTACLIGLLVLTWHRPPAWWELPVVLLLVGTATVVSIGAGNQAAARLGFDQVPSNLAVQMTRLSALASPAALAAGLAVAQLAVSTADKAVRFGAGLSRQRRWLVPLAVLLGGWRAAGFAGTLGDRGTSLRPVWAEMVGGVVLLAAVWFLCRWLLRVARRTPGELRAPPAEESLDEVGRIALPVGAALVLPLLPVVLLTSLGYVLTAFGGSVGLVDGVGDVQRRLGSATAITVVRLTVGAALLAHAWWLARRGRALQAMVSGAPGLVVIVLQLGSVSRWLSLPWSVEVLVETTNVGAVLALLLLAVRRALTPERVAGLLAVVAIAWAYAFGDLLGSPLTALIGLSGAGALLYGLVWSFLTGGATSNEGSRHFPVQSRVLIFLASSTFAVGGLAFSSTVRSSTFINLGGLTSAELGEQVLGGSLLLVAWFTLVWRVLEPLPVPAVVGEP